MSDEVPIEPLIALQQSIGYTFNQPGLLQLALTAPSASSVEILKNNQRLEFLGDSVLQLVITELLYDSNSEQSEGVMTRMRSRLVSGSALAKLAKQLNLGQYLILGLGDERSGGRKRTSTLADAFEALVGAIYLDSDYLSTKKYLETWFSEQLIEVKQNPEATNPKGELQEILQSIAPESPVYRVLSQHGPDHQRIFEIEVIWQNQMIGTGKGHSKKRAELMAAQNALELQLWSKNIQDL